MTTMLVCCHGDGSSNKNYGLDYYACKRNSYIKVPALYSAVDLHFYIVCGMLMLASKREKKELKAKATAVSF